MDRGQSMHTATGAFNEAFTLLCDTTESQSYQAYCATEVPSCPPSPETLIPSPLRVRNAHSQQIHMNTQTTSIDASEQETYLIQAATHIPDNHADLARSVTKGRHSAKQTQWTNQRGYLKLLHRQPRITLHSIRHAGSHLLAIDEVTVYDQTLPSPRVQQLKQTGIVTKHTIPRKSIPHDEDTKEMSCRPLPLVPLEKAALESHSRCKQIEEGRCVRCLPKTPGSAGLVQDDRDDMTSMTCCKVACDISRTSPSGQLDYNETPVAGSNMSPRESLLSTPTIPTHDAHVSQYTQTTQGDYHVEHIRIPSSTGLHTLCELAYDEDDKEITSGKN
jgi:hypothetical protein